MKQRLFPIAIILTLLLSACGPQLSLNIDQDETKIFLNEEGTRFSVYVRYENTGQLPSPELYTVFSFSQPLQEKLDDQQSLLFANRDGEPEWFQIDGGKSYAISSDIIEVDSISAEVLENAVTVELYNADDELIAKYVIETIEVTD